MEELLRIYKSFWVNGTDVSHKTSRNDFWIALWWNLIVYILILGYIMAYKQREGAVFGIFVLVVYAIANVTPLVTVTIRRYNDIGLSRYWLILTLVVPVVSFVLSFFMLSLILKIVAGVLFLADLIILMLPKNQFGK